MLRYEFLSALEAICREQSFEKAAKALHVTQSAISQRIRALEEELGQRVLHRGPPVVPTKIGEMLLGHVQQVSLLEKELGDRLALGSAPQHARVTIAVNADSLGTWVLPALSEFLRREEILVEFVLDDEAYTHELLERGQVIGCLSARSEAFSGCDRTYLGAMRYFCMATKQFQARFFSNGFTRQAVELAPAVQFNRKDAMHEQFLRSVFGRETPSFNPHFVPSPEQFVGFIRRGIGYGLVAHLQLHKPREMLRNLTPKHRHDVKLYWHRWRVRSPFLARVDEAVIRGAEKFLLKD